MRAAVHLASMCVQVPLDTVTTTKAGYMGTPAHLRAEIKGQVCVEMQDWNWSCGICGYATLPDQNSFWSRGYKGRCLLVCRPIVAPLAPSTAQQRTRRAVHPERPGTPAPRLLWGFETPSPSKSGPGHLGRRIAAYP